MDEEEWRAVAGLEDLYEVSSRGRVRSKGRVRTFTRYFPPKEMKGSPANGGYLKVTLRSMEEPVTRNIHVLVAEAFHGPRPDGSVAAHANGDPSDNRAENLRWATQRENTRDRWSHGTEPAGEKNGSARITADDVRYIRGSQRSNDELASMFGVSAGHVKNVRRRASWGHVE